MPVRRILKWPSAKLRLKSKPIVDFTEAKVIAIDCADTMKANLGVGVAAPQVGINKELLVIDAKTMPSLEESTEVPGCCVIINPEIEILDDEKFEWEEACLSVDDVQASVKRYANVKLTYTDLSEQTSTHTLQGVESGVLQHEADHLDGKLFIDHLPFYERKQLMKKIKRKNADKTKQRREKNRKVAAELKRVASRKKRKKQKKTYGKNKRKK